MPVSAYPNLFQQINDINFKEPITTKGKVFWVLTLYALEKPDVSEERIVYLFRIEK